MKLENSLWTEKYRPSDFSDIKGQKEIVKRVKAFVEQKNLPHLMFAGPAGVGKTSLSLVIAKKLFKDMWRQNVLELNAYDERGIDVVRNKVKDFARTRAIGDVPFKIIYLDECDALTREAQQALRRTMENYTQTCRFVLSIPSLYIGIAFGFISSVLGITSQYYIHKKNLVGKRIAIAATIIGILILLLVTVLLLLIKGMFTTIS